MIAASPKGIGQPWRLASFVVGSGVNWIFLRSYFRFVHGQSDELTQNWFAELAFTLIGGVAASFYLLPIIANRIRREGRRLQGYITWAGFMGVVAMWLCLLTMFAGIALVISLRESPWTAPLAFFFVFLGTVTYGMQPLVLSIPVGFFNGLLWGLVVWFWSGFRNENGPSRQEPRDVSTRALCIGILGLLFPLPTVGMLLSLVAIVYALVARRYSNLQGTDWSKPARVALVLGVVGCFLKVWVYVAPSFIR